MLLCRHHLWQWSNWHLEFIFPSNLLKILWIELLQFQCFSNTSTYFEAMTVLLWRCFDFFHLFAFELKIFMQIFLLRMYIIYFDQGKRSNDPEYVSNQALRLMCDNVLQLLATTVEDMESVRSPILKSQCLINIKEDHLSTWCYWQKQL